MRTCNLIPAVVVCLSLVGCGGAEVSRVTGQVMLDGEPLNKVCVYFWPSHDVTLGIMVQEKTDEEGCFDIRPNPDMGEGKAGLYRVGIGDTEAKGALLGMAMAGMSNLKSFKGRRLPPIKYWQAETSPLMVTIKPGLNELDPFELDDEPVRRAK